MDLGPNQNPGECQLEIFKYAKTLSPNELAFTDSKDYDLNVYLGGPLSPITGDSALGAAKIHSVHQQGDAMSPEALANFRAPQDHFLSP